MKLTEAQILMGDHLSELRLVHQFEWSFCERQWRFDVALPNERIAIEIHGGQYSKGHRTAFWGKKEAARRRLEGSKTTPQEDEYDKLNEAQMLGWRVMQFSNQQVLDGRAKQWLAEHLGGKQ